MPSTNPEVKRRASAAYRKRYPERVKADQARYYRRNRAKRAVYASRRYAEMAYGDPDIREKLLVAQSGRCASCGSDSPGNKKGWHVDHNHTTGVVRAVLCHPCNTALGLLKEDPAAIRALADYAEKHK